MLYPAQKNDHVLKREDAIKCVLVRVDGVTLEITHPDREILPGITKRRLIEYYVNVWEKMRIYLKDRPLTLFRMGDNGMFIQKNIQNPPPFLETVEIDGTNYAIVNDLPSLVYLVNLRTFSFHIPLARKENIRVPDWIVIDIDPYPPAKWDDVVTVTLALKELLHRLRLRGYVKLSGKNGIHVFVPSDGRNPYDVTRILAMRICSLIHSALPETTTMKYGVKEGILLDYNQNQWFRSMAAPYTLRENGKVSLPIEWKDVEDPPEPNIELAEEWVDPWKGALEPQDISYACKVLGIKYQPISSDPQP